MYSCPQCSATVTLGQFLRHTWWTPIECRSCSSKLRVNRKEIWKHCTPALLFTFSSVATRHFLPNYMRGLRMPFLIIGSCAILYLVYGLYAAKLEVIKNG